MGTIKDLNNSIPRSEKIKILVERANEKIMSGADEQ